MKIRVAVFCALVGVLISLSPLQAHSPGLKSQSFSLPAQAIPFYPMFRGNQLWFSPLVPAGTLMYLINGKITTVQLPPAFADDGGFLLTSNTDGGMWVSAGYAGSSTQNFAHLTAKNQISVYSIKGELATSSVAGADGSLWYTGDGSSISKISLSGVVTHFQINPSYPYGAAHSTTTIVGASDGSFWSAGSSGMIHITPQGKWSTFFLPPYYGGAQQLTALPDGKIWGFSTGNAVYPAGHIVIMDEKGKTQSYTFDEPANVMDPDDTGYEQGYTKNFVSVLAHDGTLWFLDYRHRQIVHSTIYGHVIKLYSFPGLMGSVTGAPAMLTMGADGALWLTEPDVHQIVRLTLP